jgi:hypothetical protein
MVAGPTERSGAAADLDGAVERRDEVTAHPETVRERIDPFEVGLTRRRR